MALDVAVLQASINSVTNELFVNAGNLTSAQAQAKYAHDMAAAIKTFIEGADGVYQPVSLQAAGSPVTATAPVAIKLQ